MPVWQSAADILRMRGEERLVNADFLQLSCYTLIGITFLNPFIPLVSISSKKEFYGYVEIYNVPNKNMLEKKFVCCSDSFVLTEKHFEFMSCCMFS